MVTTFLITIDLSSFAIQLQGGQQYVVGVTEAGGVSNWISGGGAYRQIRSRATGPPGEDLYQQFDTPANLLPGFLGNQLSSSWQQHAGFLSVTPTFAVGDVNQDGAINLLDVESFIDLLSLGEYQFEADIDGNGVVNPLDVDPFILLLSGG